MVFSLSLLQAALPTVAVSLLWFLLLPGGLGSWAPLTPSLSSVSLAERWELLPAVTDLWVGLPWPVGCSVLLMPLSPVLCVRFCLLNAIVWALFLTGP